MPPADISIIFTGHREGLLSGPSCASARAARIGAEAAGLRVETIVVLDRADRLTSDTVRSAFGQDASFLETDTGDPGQARNAGIEKAAGICSAFHDGDDLWSANWLTACWMLNQKRPDAVLHPQVLLSFGDRRHIYLHVDSESPACEPGYLSWMNYWDSMSFARTEIYRQYPFKENDLQLRFGHEDWHWNALTLACGVPHKPVPGTMHFKRSRSGSQMSRVDGVGGIRWPLGAAHRGAVPR
jgi:hypothetical protein